MDDELRAAFAATNAAIDATNNEMRTAFAATNAAIAATNNEMRTAFAATNAEMRAGFGKHDGYFGMLHKQQVDGFDQIDVRLSGIEERLAAVEQEVFGVKHEFQRFRDWVDERVRDLRSSITQLTRRFEAMG